MAWQFAFFFLLQLFMSSLCNCITQKIAEAILIYPNPVTDSQLHIKNIPANSSYKIFNATGIPVLTGTINVDQPIDISMLRAGVYFISFIEHATLQRTSFIVMP